MIHRHYEVEIENYRKQQREQALRTMNTTNPAYMAAQAVPGQMLPPAALPPGANPPLPPGPPPKPK